MRKIILVLMAVLGLTSAAKADLLTLKDLPLGGQWYVCQDEKTFAITYTSVEKYSVLQGSPHVLVRELKGELTAKGTDKTLSFMAGPEGIRGFNPDDLPVYTTHSRSWFKNGSVVKESNQKCRRVESYEGYAD